MTKLIESTTTETLPDGTALTTLHLTPEGRAGLSTNGARIPVPESTELTVHDPRIRMRKALRALHLGSAIAVALALLGIEPVVCAMVPSFVVSIPSGLWSWRDWQARKRRKAARR